MALIETQAPAAEPISLAQARLALRMDADMTDDDAWIELAIKAARRHAEGITGRSFIRTGWTQTFDEWPEPGCPLLLQRSPVIELIGIRYLPVGGDVYADVDPSTYRLDGHAPTPRIGLRFGHIWPVATPEMSAIQVDFVAGYGADEIAVPAGIKDWIARRVVSLVDHRSEVELTGKVQPLPFLEGLLDTYTAMRY